MILIQGFLQNLEVTLSPCLNNIYAETARAIVKPNNIKDNLGTDFFPQKRAQDVLYRVDLYALVERKFG